jgi:glycosyltransferase involved in cell wall biosynthesis
MKILMISPHLPGPKTYQAGERLVFELLKLLSEKHEVHLAVRVQEGEDLGPIEALCKKVHPVFYTRPRQRGLFGLLQVVYSYYRLCRRANALAKKEAFDVIHAEWTETGLFLRKQGVMVIQAHDVLTKPMERRYRNAQGIARGVRGILYVLTRMLERRVYAKFDRVFVLSEYDRKLLLSLWPLLSVAVLNYPAGLLRSGGDFERDENTLLFLGAMDRGPNVEAALYFWNEILPLIRRQFPDCKFRIAGSRPVPEVRALAEKDANTVVPGFVEDLETAYKTATIFVAPLMTGGGIIVKILDALASATPVVTTSVGNEGIGATPGEQLLIGDTAADFAEKVARLLRDKPLRERVGRAGREFVAAHYGADALRKTVGEYYVKGEV